MISAHQIRAARAILEWRRVDLADKAELSVTALRSIESNLSEARDKTLLRIKTVLEDAGIEFLDTDGVRTRRQEIMIFEGREGICRFFDLVYETIKQDDGGTIAACGASETQIIELMGDYHAVHTSRMAQMLGKINVKHLVAEGDSNTPCTDYCEYRWTPREQFEPVPFYVFNDNLAVMLLQGVPQPRIFVLRSSHIAKAFRRQFDALWTLSKPRKLI